MKKIGFVDYYLNEWHANNYPDWIKLANQKLGLDYECAYGWAEKAAPNGMTTKEWCDAHGMQECATIEELCEKSDFIMILAPSDPDTHLRYVEKVFPYGKRTYVDKTFAPDTATAKRIFAIAKQHSTPFFSTSALRYAAELLPLVGSKNIYTEGGGSNLEEYVIHQCEMVVKALGVGASKVAAKNEDGATLIEVSYPDGRHAQMAYRPDYRFKASVLENGEKHEYIMGGGYFNTLIEKILTFFEKGDIDFDVNETVEVMKLREASIEAAKCGKEILL